MKVLVVSGFLGAGKTTFIQEMISRSHERLVVLENEYGSTDIDQRIIRTSDAASVWDLTEGCICCTKSADLAASVITIENTVRPDFLIVEPSGVAALSNVIANLKKIEYERITILRPITIVDAENFMLNLKQYPDIFPDQIKSSCTVAISKPDHPDPSLLNTVTRKIATLNPKADILHGHYREADDNWWKSLFTVPCTGTQNNAGLGNSLDLETYTVNGCCIQSPVHLLMILEQAVRGAFGFIVRAKGILPAGKEWLRFDIVNGRISIEGYDNSTLKSGAECVWIGRGIDRLKIAEYFSRPKITDKPLNIIGGRHHIKVPVN